MNRKGQRKLDEMKRRLAKAGGSFFVSPDLPADVAELFMKEILSCPECAAAGRAGDRGHKQTTGH